MVHCVVSSRTVAVTLSH